jgi:hypothetical protein
MSLTRVLLELVSYGPVSLLEEDKLHEKVNRYHVLYRSLRISSTTRHPNILHVPISTIRSSKSSCPVRRKDKLTAPFIKPLVTCAKIRVQVDPYIKSAT